MKDLDFFVLSLAITFNTALIVWAHLRINAIKSRLRRYW